MRKNALNVEGVKRTFISKVDSTCTEIYTEEQNHTNALPKTVKTIINGHKI